MTDEDHPGGDVTAGDSRASLTVSLQSHTHIIQLLSAIIENCLYVVWKHLDFYLVSCVPLDQDTTLFQSHHNINNKLSTTAAVNSSMRKLTGKF